jgi:hypothetical protein
MEELISNHPFGDIEGIVLGHGSFVGRYIFTLKKENVDDLLDEILQLTHTLSTFELILLAFHRNSDGII